MYMFDHIALFTQLVEIGSFNKTAEVVRISPPTLTRKIQELETYMNVQLLQRDTRNISLTHNGELLYLKFKDLRKELANLLNVFNPIDKRVDDRLKVTLPAHWPSTIINPYLSYFLNQNPGVKLSVRYRIVKPDFEKDFHDIMVTSHYVNDSRFDFRFLRSESISLYCTPSYIEKYGQPTTIDELIEHNVMSGIDPNTDMDVDYTIFTNKYTKDKHYIDSTNSRIRLNSSLGAREIGMAGECIFGSWGFLCEDDLRMGKLIHVLPEYEAFSVDFYIVSRKTIRPVEQLFIDFIYRCANRLIANDVLNNS